MILVELGWGFGGLCGRDRAQTGGERREGEVLQLLDLDKFPAVSYGQGYHHSLSFGAGRLCLPIAGPLSHKNLGDVTESCETMILRI